MVIIDIVYLKDMEPTSGIHAVSTPQTLRNTEALNYIAPGYPPL